MVISKTYKPESGNVSLAIGGQSRWPMLVAFAIGITAALLTMSLEYLPRTSLGQLRFLLVLLFPGILGSDAIGGNFHAFGIWIAAAINCIIYSLISWAICSTARRASRWFR